MECEKQKIKMTPLVIECGGSSGSTSNWKKGASPNSDIVLKLAQRLGVSTDYLLGNTKAPNISTGDVKNSVVGSINSAVNIGTDLNDIEKELINTCKKLDMKNQVKLLQFAYKLEEE